MRVGFVGLGDQGEPMAQRILAAGHELAVFARRAVQAEPLCALGAEVTNSLAALAERSEMLGICVGTDTQVKEVAETAIPAMGPGSIIAVHSTVHPDTCTALEAFGALTDVSVLDAPVSGGRARAVRGELTVMVGGPPSVLALARPVFETYSRLIVHVGGVGSGQTLKLLNNFLFAAQIAVTEDAIAACRALDLDVDAALRAVAESTGATRAIQMFLEGGCAQAFPRHSAGYAHGAGLLGKDLELMDTLMPSGAMPPLLNLIARAGLNVARHTMEQ